MKFKCQINSTVKAILNSIFFGVMLFISHECNSQNITYTSLYNSSNFIKTVDLTKLIGVINGEANTTPSGGISYTIPIYTPPGTNGIEPSISLSYNSSAGTGVAGLGWGISGLSAISRTGMNMYHNGNVGPVTYTNADAFLLDGVRLNAVTGVNGANNTIYALETENFSKIVSNTTVSPNNPNWFKVTAKDGSVMEFGNTTDSRIMADNNTSNVIYWRLNRIIDVNNNYIDFKYDNTLRDSRLIQVLYTGNSTTGLQPYNQINFTYKTRTDVNTFYDAGASLTNNYLLEKVAVVHTNDAGANSTVKTYKLNYGFDNVSSYLKEIIEYGGAETDASLNSTIFLYGDQPQNIANTTTSALTGDIDFYSGDFDADGKTDMIAANKYYDNNIGTVLHTGYSLITDINLVGSSVTVMYNKSLSQGSSIDDISKAKFFNFLTADYNGDGRDDVMQVNSSIEQRALCTGALESRRKINSFAINYTKGFNSNTGYTDYTEQNFTYPSSAGIPYQYVSPLKNNFFIPGDFDGNGNQDYITILAKKTFIGVCPTGSPLAIYTFAYKAFITSPSTNESNIEVANFGVGTNNYGDGFYAETITQADKINTIDFDGDGKLEILVTKNMESYILSLQKIPPSSTGGFTTTLLLTTSLITKDTKYFPGGFNGDRKTDLLVRNSNGTWNILYSTGTAFLSTAFAFTQGVGFSSNQITDKIVVSDFNGDGKSDILHGYAVWVGGVSTSSKFSLYYCRGASFYYEQYDYNKILGAEFIVGDFNGDGRSDFFNRISSSNGGADFVAIKPFGKERLLTKITTGHNVTTAFDYKLLTDKNVYPYFYDRTVSLDNAANANPYNYVQLPMYALSSLTVPDGIAGNKITTYTYADAVLHRAAKGLLGFKKIVAQNNVNGVRTTIENEINTQFATAYNTKQTVYSTFASQQLSQTTTTTSFTNLSTGSADKRYLQKVDKVFTADNLNYRATESANTFDAYGNVILNVSKKGTLSGTTVTAIETTNTTTVYSIQNTPFPAKPDNITVTKTRSGMPSVSAKTVYTYNTKGLIATEKTFDGLAKSVTKTYAYNNFGNSTSTITTANSLPTTTVTASFDTKGRYIIQQQTTGTGVSQVNSFTFNSAWGLPLTETTSDCLTTTYTYDAFGRLNYTLFPDGNTATVTNFWNLSGNALYYVLTNYAGGKPDTKIYYDKFDREWKSETVSANGDAANWHTVITTFDNKGNIKTKTLPYFPSTETARTTTTNYDAFNRVSSTINDIGTTAYTYTITPADGKVKITVTNPASQASSTTSDAAGRTVTALDNGGQLDYKYDSWGNQTEVKNGSIVLVSSVYDEYGRQTSMTDVNAGTTTYAYNAYGQLTNQTDAKNNSYTLQYDPLGRLISKTGSEGTITYEYYKDAATGCNNNVISKVTGFNGVKKEYTFDALKRPLTEKYTIDFIPYTTTFAYNSYSQLSQTTYPSGVNLSFGSYYISVL